jgi:hypothetical protein
MKSNLDVLDELKNSILARLELCKTSKRVSMPKVCELSKTEVGKTQIVQFVTNMVAQGELDIIHSLMEMERTINPNMCVD